MIRSLDREALRARMAALLGDAPPRTLRPDLAAWAADAGVELA